MSGTPRPFEISAESLDGSAVVRVTGEVDMDTAPRLKSLLVQLTEDGVRLLTVDLAQTDFLDSTGLNALVIAATHARKQGGDLVLRSPSRAAARVLDLTGLTSVVKVV